MQPGYLRLNACRTAAARDERSSVDRPTSRTGFWLSLTSIVEDPTSGRPAMSPLTSIAKERNEIQPATGEVTPPVVGGRVALKQAMGKAHASSVIHSSSPPVRESPRRNRRRVMISRCVRPRGVEPRRSSLPPSLAGREPGPSALAHLSAAKTLRRRAEWSFMCHVKPRAIPHAAASSRHNVRRYMVPARVPGRSRSCSCTEAAGRDSTGWDA